MKRIVMATLWLLFLAVVLVACQNDDDDNNSADDDSADDDTFGWPDQVEPVVGWVAIGTASPPVGSAWVRLYQINENGFKEVETPGDYVFIDGSLPTKDVGWALNNKQGTNDLYRLENGAWTLMDPQPPCPAYGSSGPEMSDTFVFADGKGYVVCQGAYLLAWDSEEWTTHELPKYEPGHRGTAAIDCLSWNECVVWNDRGLFWWNGSDFDTEERECSSQLVLQNSKIAYRIFRDNCDNEYSSLEVRCSGIWEVEEGLIPYYA